ncbi:D-ribose pyranase [Paeniglutamicibacter sulfureus]|uniref:D-ribose pyranase n=1 Tax=Paeniglutamicibacter sulfureus TaxID=43666 RepID=A0ABU2BKL2_9MICC|nr:D-ribose pyranase [Paeniglutamicibacter sulfureus]MDO2934588.1 D-ribose pyranase [Paeniglutamicibacter sulfureus]MDR7358781.1 D-ribose pyranase [Paeniglutamicibacter sulfureus]
MRKNNGTLNPALSRVISETGHTDEIVITDAGLPIPASVERIDFALKPGTPGFLEVLDVVLNEMEVEGVVLAREVQDQSPAMFSEIKSRFDELGIALQLIPHTEFKERTKGARAAVRSGETTSYANVILQAGVVY